MGVMVTCEVCGGHDVVKDATGLFVCAGCGVKYSVEAVRAMLSRGDGDGEGTGPAPGNAITKADDDAAGPRDVDGAEAGAVPMGSVDARLSPGTTSGRIEALFSEGRDLEAAELYDASVGNEPMGARAHLFGCLAAARAALRDERGRDAHAAARTAMLLFVESLRLEGDAAALRAERLAEGLADYAEAMGRACLEAGTAAGLEEDPEKRELKLEAADYGRGGCALGVRMALSELSLLASGGAAPSSAGAERARAVCEEALGGWFRPPFVDRQLARLAEGWPALPDGGSPEAVRTTARRAWADGDCDLSARLYERLLEMVPGDPEALCLVRSHAAEAACDPLEPQACSPEVAGAMHEMVDAAAGLTPARRLELVERVMRALGEGLVALHASAILSLGQGEGSGMRERATLALADDVMDALAGASGHAVSALARAAEEDPDIMDAGRAEAWCKLLPLAPQASRGPEWRTCLGMIRRSLGAASPMGAEGGGLPDASCVRGNEPESAAAALGSPEPQGDCEGGTVSQASPVVAASEATGPDPTPSSAPDPLRDVAKPGAVAGAPATGQSTGGKGKRKVPLALALVLVAVALAASLCAFAMLRRGAPLPRGASAGAGQRTAFETSSQAGTKTVKLGVISIEVPTDWHVDESGRTRWAYPDRRLVMQAEESTWLPGGGKEEAAGSSYKEFIDWLEQDADYTVDEGSSEVTNLGWATRYRTGYAYRLPGGVGKGKVDLLVLADSCYILKFLIPEEMYDLYSGDFLAVLDSVRFGER